MVLITKMFLSLESRPDLDKRELFTYENQREPPVLADRGNLRKPTNKADIIKCVQLPPAERRSVVQPPDATVAVFDMAAVCHLVNP